MTISGIMIDVFIRRAPYSGIPMRNVRLFLLASTFLAPANAFGQAAVKQPSKIGEVHLQLGKARN